MRTNEERVAAVKSRAAQLECQKRLRQKRLLALACACASLAVIVGAALALPHLQTNWRGAAYQTTASIFADSAVCGYVLIALLAFALGVCVTVLCYRLRVFHEESEEDSDDRTL